MWIDNFNGNYATSSQTVVSGAYRACNWMGRGVKLYIGSQAVDLHANNIPDGLPTSLFCAANMGMFKAHMKTVDEHEFTYEHSYCTRHDVRTVPPKREVRFIDNPALHQLLAEKRDGLKNFYPLDVLDTNPGQHVSFLQYFKKFHFDAMTQDEFGPVKAMMADVGIYQTICKVHSHTSHI
jgi:hypothetical protein